MTIKSIEKFCDEKAKEIAKIIASEYSQTDLDVDTISIEKEIFEVSSGYASIFVFQNRFLISSEDKEYLKTTIASRFNITNREINKMNLRDLIAHLIKSYSINYLNEIYDLVLI